MMAATATAWPGEHSSITSVVVYASATYYPRLFDTSPPKHHPLPTMPHFPPRLPAPRRPPPVRPLMRTQDRGA
jgi:hypothetical protein